MICDSLGRVELHLGRRMPRAELLRPVHYLAYAQRGRTVRDGAGEQLTGYTLQTRSGVNLSIPGEVGPLDAQNPSLTAQIKGFQSLPVRFRQRPRFTGIQKYCENAAGI